MPFTTDDRVLYRSDENLPMLREWGAALRRARQRQGVSQTRLGARVGVDPVTIRLIECGTLDGSLTLWLDLIGAHGIALDDVIPDSVAADAVARL